ncbi:MAG: hypothetical protein ACREI1_07035 [Nitrospiraceae bacterium]
MSRTSLEQTCILVDLIDAEGHAPERTVPVTLDYLVDIDQNYGADADGHRGITRAEYMVLDKAIEAQELLTLTSDQVERALAEAETIFHQGGLTMANRQNGERTCVMIVEQDWDFGMKLADWLAAHGYQPVLVRSVDAAIDELSAIRPHAVFVGLRASKPQAQLNANEVLLMIQTICPLVPMITIADEANQAQTQVVFRQGGRSFLVKPVEFSQIGEVLKSAVSAATV